MEGPREDPGGGALLGRLGALVEARRGSALALVLAATALVAAAGFPRLRVDNSNETSFRAGDPIIADYRELKRRFGEDEFAVVALAPPAGDVFATEVLAAIGDLEARLRALEHVRKKTSIRSVRFVEAGADEIRTRRFLPDLPAPPGARAAALAHPRYAGTYVSRDGGVAAIVLDTAVPVEDNEGKILLAARFRAILAEPRFAALAPRLAGAPIFEADFDARTSAEGALFFGQALLVSGAFHWRGLASPRAAAVPLAVAVLGAVLTLSLMGLAGRPVSMDTVILPALLITVGVADAVHLIESVRERGAAAAYATDGVACLVTALTTAAGFFAFATSDVMPLRTLGTFSGFGVLICLGLAFALAPWAVQRNRTKPPKTPTTPKGPGTEFGVFGVFGGSGSLSVARLAAWAVRRRRAVLVGAAVLAAVAATGVARLRIDTWWLDAFRESSELRRSFRFVDERLDGAFSLEVVIDGGRAGALEDPVLLGRIDRFETAVRADPAGIVGSVYGPPDLVAEVHAAFAAGTDAAGERLPRGGALVAQELLLLEESDVNDVLDFDRRIGRVQVRVRSRPGSEYLALIARVEAAARGAGLDARTTGVSKLFSVLAAYTTESQIQGFATAFVAIAALLAVLLGSLRLGLLALVPNLLPIGLTLGAMGFLGLPLDMITTLVACVALGISDDDTVHFFVHFRRAAADGLPADEAARRTAAELARPAAAMTAARAAGVLVFCAGSTLHLARFGAVTAAAIALAFACEMVVTPALLAAFYSLPRSRSNRSNIASST